MPFSSVTLATSIYAVGVQVSSNTLVIRADSCGTGGFTWLNEEPTAIGDELKLSEDVTCKQTSVRQYICTDSSAFHLVVDMYEGRLSVQSWTNKCEDSRGLFGPCGSDGVFNDFLSSSGSSLDPNTDLNIKNIYEKFAASWQADNQNTMFSAVLPNYIPSSVEMCLQSTDGHAISEPVNTFTKANVSIEIKFYLEETVTDCATLWSYHSLETFSVLICDSYVNLYHSKQKIVLRKLKKIRAHTWYHLSTVWNDKDSGIDMFLLVVSKASESEFKSFAENPLIPGGQFTIGQMYYDSTMELEVLSWNFNGYFDEFIIWKKQLDLTYIVNNAFSYKIGTEEGLSTLWRFNEGYGNTSFDSSLMKLKMEWVSEPRAHPEWTICGYPMEYPALTQRNLDSIRTDISAEIVDTCSLLLGKTGLQQNMTGAAWLKLNQQCQFNSYTLGDKSKALVILALVDSYMVGKTNTFSDIRTTYEWPGRALCNDFRESYATGWTGEDCSLLCLSGDYNYDSEECMCSAGFWGAECGKICPYARNSVCGGGICNNGTCTCTLEKYDATNGCKTCLNGWMGSDCSIALAELSSSNKRMAMIFSLGHIIMFDGQSYDIHSPGQFVLMESSDIGVYVRMKPFGESVCVEQMWLKLSGDKFIIQTPVKANSSLIFWHNLQNTQFTDSYKINENAVIEWENQKSLIISLPSYGQLEVKITYIEFYLDIQVIFDSPTCLLDVSGLLGNCDRNVDNDFYSDDFSTLSHDNVNQNIIDTAHANKFKLKDNTGFVYVDPNIGIQEPEKITNGYSLLFNEWGIMSEPLPQSVFDFTKDITFDIKMKIYSESGLILGYSSDSKFALFVNNLKLKIFAFGTAYDTNFTFATEQWYHIFISYETVSDNVAVSVFIESILHYQGHLLIPSLDFGPGGYLVLGHWQVDPPNTFEKLKGMIGHLRVWSRILDDYGMYDATITHIVAGYDDLVLLFEFNEGFGYVTTDSVNGLEMSLPKTGEVIWFITDLPQLPKASEECKPENEIATRFIGNKNQCIGLFKSEIMTSACAQLGSDFAAGFFYEACFTDNIYVSSLNAYIDLCTTVIDPPNPPIANICTDKTSDHYPFVCSKYCNFGVMSKSGCKCLNGYWGETCNNICPGGSENPCHGNGKCDEKSGFCTCLQGYLLPDCATCKKMFMPPSCMLRYPPTFNPDDNTVNDTEIVNSICSMSSVGYVINYMQVSYSFDQFGQFYLVRPDTENDKVPDIQICTVPCYCGRACITALYMKYKSESVSIRGSYSSSENVAITINDNLLYTSTTKTGLHNMVIETLSETQTSIKSLDNEFQVLVSHSLVDKRYLNVGVQILGNATNCQNQLSICGNCSEFSTDTIAPVETNDVSLDVQTNSRCNALANHESTTGTGGTGGFCIEFVGTGETVPETLISKTRVVSNILKGIITNENDLTISFKLKPMVNTGTIFTYSEHTVFDSFLDHGILKFMAGNQLYNSDIFISIGNWHHISLVWSILNQHMMVYVTTLIAGSSTQNAYFAHPIPKEAFANYGRLSIGSYNPPFNHLVSDPIKQDFVGNIDEFFVFARKLEASEEAKYRYASVPLDEDSLVLYYKFDDVVNGIIPDLVSGNDLKAVTAPWNKPKVSFSPSDLPTDPLSQDEEECVLKYTTDALAAATNTCAQYFSNTKLITLCGRHVDIDLYMDSCVSMMHATDNKITAFESVALYAEKCNLVQEMKNETDFVNAKQFLCSSNNVATGYVGVDCDIPCKFPDPQSDGLSCSCATGYYGDHCDQVCPGGAENPCHGNGVCDKLTGICKCLNSYQGDSCDRCASSWLGKGCQVIIQKPRPRSEFYSCSLTSHNNFKTFDGSYLPLDTKHFGTFMFYQDQSMKINIQIGACDNSDRCIIAIAFETEGTKSSIVPRENGIVKLNGVDITIDNSLFLSTKYKLKHPRRAFFLLEGPNRFSVQVYVQLTFLNVFVSKSSCPVPSNTVGICGGCDSIAPVTCPLNDLVCSLTNVGIAETITNKTDLGMAVIRDYYHLFHLEYKNSVFAAAGESDLTPGYMIKLQSPKSYISFPSFGEEIYSSSDARAIEIRGQFETANSGTVFSYSKDQTFGLVIEDGKFVIKYGNESFPTNISVAIGEPCNIGVSYNVQTGEVLFDYIYGDSNIHSYHVIDSIGTGALDAGGSLVIGQWVSFTSSVPDGDSVFGVDRVCIWDRALSPDEFQYNWRVNKFTREPGLSSVYNMNEGTGFETTDSLTGNTAQIDEASSWTEGSLYVIPESTGVSETSDIVIISETAKAVCGELKAALVVKCSALSSSLEAMYDSCCRDVSRTGNPDDSLYTAINAANECSGQLNIENPLIHLCNDFPTKLFPYSAGPNCDLQCNHGTYTQERGCECDVGYYGQSCDETCPGGPVPPCNGHGTCTNDGQCECDLGWNKDTLCSSCATNYSPPNCDKLVIQPPERCTGNKCSMHRGRVIGMDCNRKLHNITATDLIVLSTEDLIVTVSIMGSPLRKWCRLVSPHG